MDRLIDEIVKIKVTDAPAAAAAASVNTAAVVGVSTKSTDVTVQYGQEGVEGEYYPGLPRILELAPSVSEAGDGTVLVKLGDEVLASATTNENSTVQDVVSALVSSFDAENYTAKTADSRTKVVITANASGTDRNADTITATYSTGCGFSGSVTQKQAGADGDELSKVTRSFFLEANTPGRIVCIPTASVPSVNDIADTLENALSLGKDKNNRDIEFYHVVLRFAKGTTAASIISLIEGTAGKTGLEDWCVENTKLAHVELMERSVASDVLAGLSKTPTRVAFYYHDEANERSLAAAIVADRCGTDPARGSWALKTITSVVADATSKADLIDAQEMGLNIYAKVAGVDTTYFGSIASKTQFIDSLVKKDWLRFRVQESVFNLLRTGNRGFGVVFNDSGIPSVAAAVNSVFALAVDDEHQYVLPDSYEVTVPLYKDIPAEDIRVRNLPRVRATFSIQETIHTVKTVELQIV